MSRSEPTFDACLEQAKLEAMKELAYGASHEINNPLANISARAQTLLRGERDPERRRALEAIHAQAMRAHEMISDLMLFARPPRLELQEVDAARLAAGVVAELATECGRRQIVLTLATDEGLPPIAADATQLAVALKAVCTNAFEAIGREGRVELSVAPEQVAAADGERTAQGVRIRVYDNGPGISANVRSHIFDPFYSGREAGRGLGFGLAKAWRIVAEHGGRICVEADLAQGAAVTLELPACCSVG
jgi:signal transduction histidine kinase